MYCPASRNIGFVSTRLVGTDGVSMEAKKWADILERECLNCYYFAGELDTPPQRSMVVKEAHFINPKIKRITEKCFNRRTRRRTTTQEIQRMKDKLKRKLYFFIDKYKIEVLIVENALSIPLNIPLGLAITEVIAETGIQVVGHHHDFFWERQRFLTNAVWDYLNMAFPPHLPQIHHVSISSAAASQLSLRTGITSTVIPNVMDFENPPLPIDDYAADVRQSFGIKKNELFILQPTRIVPRKGIEHAIELVSHLKQRAKLVITHKAGDEGYEYQERIKSYSETMKVKTIFVSDYIRENRSKTSDGKKIYTLFDIYPHADLITYPSEYEGFGNAFLEAVYFRKPLVTNNYSIYAMDIKPKGFKVIELNGYVTEEAVAKTEEILKDEELWEKAVNHNYELAKQYYSYSVLQKKLKSLLLDCFGG